MVEITKILLTQVLEKQSERETAINASFPDADLNLD